MEERRIDLQVLLEEMIGSRNVYYQPPASVKMRYPAIVYFRNNIGNRYANNNIYDQMYSYQLIVIDPDPDSEIVKKVSKLPLCSYDRHYTADNLNHDVFTIFY